MPVPIRLPVRAGGARDQACAMAARLGLTALALLSGPFAVAQQSSHVQSGYQSAVRGLPAIDLATTPLYATGTRAKPTLTLALSVEFPTVGAQYLDNYTPQSRYIGYFDAGSCYAYVNADESINRRFDRIGPGSGLGGHECQGAGFSGNFMNWASSSAIDVLRLALTGGDRIVDTADMTVLQRAVLPPEQGGFWNGANFPSKRLAAGLAAGAVPQALRADHKGDIFIANCENRVHFGTGEGGNCSNPGVNGNLGANTRSELVLTGRGRSNRWGGGPPWGYQHCANEGEFCHFTGVRQVAYGHSSLLNYNLTWQFAYASNGFLCSNELLTDPERNRYKACYIAADNGEWTPQGDRHEHVLTRDRFFYARVQVCERGGTGTSDPRGIDYCQLYPAGNFKPIGNLQRYSDRVRVAAFGYLQDGDTRRYGGVLRAPMRFVGAKDFDHYGAARTGTNPFMEWESQTGVFHIDPDNARQKSSHLQAENSGVINYLNKFGRTGSQTGYKERDPVAELYYEALRYVQGLQPTPQAHQNMHKGMRQGFPVHTTWSDPHAGMDSSHDYSCVRNSILTIGDQNTHYDRSIPGNSQVQNLNRSIEFARAARPADNEPDFVGYSNLVGRLEPGLSGSDANLGERIYPEGGSSPGYLMAGMAYWARTRDIRGEAWGNVQARRLGMRVTTYVLDVNEYGSQGNAQRRHRSPYFLAAKYGGFIDNADSKDPHTPGNVWQKDGSPGEARTYYLASSAQDVIEGLDEIFAAVALQAGNIAGGAVSSSELYNGETGLVYRGQFDGADWSGDLVATRINSSQADGLSVGTIAWSADQKLRAMAPARRNIVVGRTQPGRGPLAGPFTWEGIEQSLKDSLSGTAGEARGRQRLQWLRGSREQEGGSLRSRVRLLGDIINSGAVFSGPPPTSGIVDADYYQSELFTRQQQRRSVVFVGSNGGMLHAFDAGRSEAGGGTELFAYIPSWVAPRLHLLTEINYLISEKQSFVDATPTVGQARIQNGAQAQWKTVLVSGTGAGGQGVFALDVSDPENFSAENLLWEFTDRDDADLGYVVGKPQILKIRKSNHGASPQESPYGWYAVFAGGVNNYVHNSPAGPDGRVSQSGRPALFFLDLSKPRGAPWKGYYSKLQLPVDAGAAMASGVLNFTPLLGADGAAQRLYAGDLHGRMWRLDIGLPASGAGADDSFSQRIGMLSRELNDGRLQPLFVAAHEINGRRQPQPISVPPLLYRADNHQVVVAFGTGKYLEESDNQPGRDGFAVQSFYAVLDSASAQDLRNRPAVGTWPGVIGKNWLRRAGLAEVGSGLLTPGAGGTSPFGWTTLAQVRQTGAQRPQGLYMGWYFDFTEGERQVVDGTVAGDRLLFNTLRPPQALAGICSVGDSYSYISEVVSGQTTFEASNVGLLAAPLVIDPGGQELSAFNSVGQRTRTLYPRNIQIGTDGISAGRQMALTLTLGRLSWREISNYGELVHQGSQAAP